MHLNQFESTNEVRLNQILHTLKSVYDVHINMDFDSPTAESAIMECKLAWESTRDRIISESSFNSYQQNPQYTKAMLILEAMRIMITEIAPRRRRHRTDESSADEGLKIMRAQVNDNAKPGMDNVHEVDAEEDDDDEKDLTENDMQPADAPAPPSEIAGQQSGHVFSQAHHYEYQASMARSELYRNAKYAMSMMKQVDPQGEVPPWIAGALTKAANYLDKIFHYLDYYKTFEPAQLPEGMDGDMELGETSGGVTRQNLMLIMEYSNKLFNMIQPGDKLEGWVAMKLTTASECVSSCKHYMDYVQFENHALDDHFTNAKRTNKNMMEHSSRFRSLMEQEDLAKAQAILAAKDITGKIQEMAEDVAKLSVEELMHLIDTIREQFGPEAATGYNTTVKTALDKLLDLTTSTKEELANAADTLAQGGIPAGTTDIENAEIPGEEPPVGDETSAGDELGSSVDDMDADLGQEEPLGRAKKDELAEGKKKAKNPKNTKPDFLDVDGDGNKKEPFKKALADKKKGKKVDETTTTVAPPGSPQASDTGAEVDDKVLDQIAKGRTVSGVKMTRADAAELQAKRAKNVTETAVTERAPKGAKAERFITKNKAGFKKRYGTRWKKVLYATAWEKFGEKSESYVGAKTVMEQARARMAALSVMMEKHRRVFATMVNEGRNTDPLKMGYGLEGEAILDRMGRVEKKLNEAKSIMRHAMQEGVMGMIRNIQTLNKVDALKKLKATTPYGVIYETADGRRTKKMFESADARGFWIELHGESTDNLRMIEPDTFDKAIKQLSRD